MKTLIVGGKRLKVEGNWVEISKEEFQKWLDSIHPHTSAHTWAERILPKAKQIFYRRRREIGQFGQRIPVWMVVTDTQIWRLFMLTPQLLYDTERERPTIPW